MANRKLQAEIERVIKKVTEGIEIFEATLDKLNTTQGANQKDKLESDLKKDIKKLQRLRDQIKTWIASPEVKDKRALENNRKLIEQQMERFKAIEKEMKTKAFSKEGLTLQTKVDPKEQEKAELREWIREQVESLTTQIDRFEAEIESLRVTSKKGKKDSNRERVGHLERWIERHRWYINRLELILRLVENNQLDLDEVRLVEPGVNTYVNHNQDHKFFEDDEIFNDLRLEEHEDDFVLTDAIALEELKSKEPEEKSTLERRRNSEKPLSLKGEEIDRRASKDGQSPALSQIALAASKVDQAARASATAPKSTPKTTPPTALYSVTAASLNDKTPSSATERISKEETPLELSSPSSTTPATIVTETATAITGTTGKNSPSSAQLIESPKQPIELVESPVEATPPVEAAPPEVAQPVKTTPVKAPLVAEPTLAIEQQKVSVNSPPQPSGPMPVVSPVPALPVDPFPRPKEVPEQLSAVADLFSVFESLKEEAVNRDTAVIEEHLEASNSKIVTSAETERQKYYVPRNSYPTASYYPQKPLPATEALFEKLDVDTLFFIFYYQQGTYQQYLAAKELRKSWRFHRKYRTWFRRQEFPKELENDYEKGSYIYFDYEGAWCQRKKPDFTFEYAYLEDWSI